MRKLLMAASALALLSGGAAYAENQQIYTGVAATTTTTGVTVDNGLQSQTQGVGNVLSVQPTIGSYNSTGDTQGVGANPISATSSVEGSTVSGVSSVSTLAEGNDMEINPAGVVSLEGSGGAGGNNQTTGLHNSGGANGAITATTNVGNTGADSFTGNTGVNAAAVGNNLIASSEFSTVGLGGGDAASFEQLNQDSETATVNLDNTNVAGGVLNSESQAVGNSVSATGVMSPASSLTQNNQGVQTGTENVTGDNLLSSGVGAAGNTVLASAEGNFAAIGQQTTGFVSQTNGAADSATTNLSNSTVNGQFSAQSAGDILSFASNTAATGESQFETATSTSNLNVSGPVDLNGATTFASLAIGNQFSGTLSPAQAPGDFTNQSTSAAIGANSTISGVTGNGFGATVNTTATANLATMSAPGGFQQAVTGAGVTTIASISSSAFTGGLTVNTAAIGNSIAIK